MKYLNDIETLNGFLITRIYKGKKAQLYKKEIAPGVFSYLAFLNKIQPIEIVNGILTQEQEVLPQLDDIGNTAWIFQDKMKAILRYDELEGELTFD